MGLLHDWRLYTTRYILMVHTLSMPQCVWWGNNSSTHTYSIMKEESKEMYIFVALIFV